MKTHDRRIKPKPKPAKQSLRFNDPTNSAYMVLLNELSIPKFNPTRNGFYVILSEDI